MKQNYYYLNLILSNYFKNELRSFGATLERLNLPTPRLNPGTNDC